MQVSLPGRLFSDWGQGGMGRLEEGVRNLARLLNVHQGVVSDYFRCEEHPEVFRDVPLTLGGHQNDLTRLASKLL